MAYIGSLLLLGTLVLPGVVLGYSTMSLFGANTAEEAVEGLHRPNPPITPVEVFDFVIVGGGSAGLVVANRLSANPDFKVLVLEAGGDPTAVYSIPGYMSGNINNNETDYMYRAVQKNDTCLGCKENSTLLNAGRMLGGSSMLNFMMYQRGNSRDFNNWGTLANDSGWSFDGVLPYFKKMENYQGDYPSATYHGTTGPIVISKQQHDGVIMNAWLAAGNEKGVGNTDPNGNQTSTFAPIEYFINNGKRWESYAGYLEPVLNRTNLLVRRYSKVIRVNINPVTKNVMSVTYTRLGQNITAIAHKEVILSAGAIATPQIMMLSGIGPADHLTAFGIPVIADRPGVGSNLQDHPLTFIGPFLYNDTISFIPPRDLTAEDALEYETNRTGAFALPTAAGAGMALISTTGEPQWPNVMIIHAPLGIYDGWAKDNAVYFNMKEEVMTGYQGSYPQTDASAMVLSLVRPKSRGTVRLASSSPYVKPLMDLNYLSHPDDVTAMVEGIKFFVDVFENSTAFQKWNATLIGNKLPGCEDTVWKSDAYYECWVRHWTGTQWHASGTAKMGVVSDPMAVVDSSLRVIGVNGLRVIDGSIMPNITNANTYTPIAMIGEKGSDLILADYP